MDFELEIATRANKVLIDANLATKTNVSKKSTILVCAKPFTTKHAFYLFMSLLGIFFNSKDPFTSYGLISFWKFR
jgi:hypothetical protein